MQVAVSPAVPEPKDARLDFARSSASLLLLHPTIKRVTYVSHPSPRADGTVRWQSSRCVRRGQPEPQSEQDTVAVRCSLSFAPPPGVRSALGRLETNTSFAVLPLGGTTSPSPPSAPCSLPHLPSAPTLEHSAASIRVLGSDGGMMDQSAIIYIDSASP